MTEVDLVLFVFMCIGSFIGLIGWLLLIGLLMSVIAMAISSCVIRQQEDAYDEALKEIRAANKV